MDVDPMDARVDGAILGMAAVRGVAYLAEANSAHSGVPSITEATQMVMRQYLEALEGKDGPHSALLDQAFRESRRS